MKRLITLMLMLLAPALASATNPPCTLGALPCVATAGSLTISSGPFRPGASFNASGSGFTASGGWVDVILASLGNAGEITSGEPLHIGWNANVDGGFFMSVSVDGVGYATGPGGGLGLSGGGSFAGSSFTPITGAGVYKGPLGFEGEINGAVGCPTNCQGIFVSGGGIGTFDIVATNQPGLFALSDATVTFGTPEPSTAPLLLLGFAGLAVLGWRRKSRATLLLS